MPVLAKAAVTAPTRARRTDRALLLLFLILYPLLFYPQYLVAMVWEHKGIYFSNGELVYYIPRLIALLLLAGLTWRAWTLAGWFPKILLANALWITFVTVLHPDPDGLWYTLGGNLDRLDGLVYQLLLVGVGMTAYALQRRATGDGRVWTERVGATLALSGLLPALVVLLQGAGADPIGWLVWGKPLPFASATLGHPGFAACTLLISSLLALGAAGRSHRSAAWIGVLVVEATALGVTGNRSALVALAVGTLLAWTMRRTRVTFLLAALTLLVAIGGSLAPKWVGPTTTNGEAHLVNGRTLETRLQLWRAAGHALITSPDAFLSGYGSAGLLYAALEKLPTDALVPFWRLEKGWGTDTVEHFGYASNGPQYRDVIATAVLRSPDGIVRTVQFYPGLDKAHDYFLDRALAYGVVDAVMWAVLFLVPLARALVSRESRPELAAFAPVVAALLVFGVTWFGVVQTEPLQLIVLAILWGASRSERGGEN